MNDRLNFRVWFNGRFIYKSLCDSNVYTEDDKCICLANTLPTNLPWEQCTGVKDKKGRSIYVGDVVKVFGFKDSYILVCKFRDGSFCLDHVDGRPYNFIHAVTPVEVIGNIHENPELAEDMQIEKLQKKLSIATKVLEAYARGDSDAGNGCLYEMPAPSLAQQALKEIDLVGTSVSLAVGGTK